MTACTSSALLILSMLLYICLLTVTCSTVMIIYINLRLLALATVFPYHLLGKYNSNAFSDTILYLNAIMNCNISDIMSKY